MGESEIWQRVVSGDREAFEDLYRLYGPALRGFLRHYLADAGATDDVVQETFLALWRRPNGFDSEHGTLRQYLFGIGRKQAAQWRRAASPPRQDVAAEPIATDFEDHSTIRAILRQLDPDDRGLLWLREVEGYSYAELAAILDIPVGTVKSRLFAAREALRCAWQCSPRN